MESMAVSPHARKLYDTTAQNDICGRHGLIEGRKPFEQCFSTGWRGDVQPRKRRGRMGCQRGRRSTALSQIADDHSTNFMAPFDLEACIQQLLRKQLLHEALLREICEKTKEVLMRESNVVHISAPVTVVGDIHGFVISRPPCPIPLASQLTIFPPYFSSNSSQFYDLIEIFRIGGYAPHTNYLFLGKLNLSTVPSAHISPAAKCNRYVTVKAIMWTEGCSASRPSRSLRVSNFDTQTAFS